MEVYFWSIFSKHTWRYTFEVYFLSTHGKTVVFDDLSKISTLRTHCDVPDLIFSVVFLYFLRSLDLNFLNMIHLCDVLWICLKYVNCSIKTLIEICLVCAYLNLTCAHRQTQVCLYLHALHDCETKILYLPGRS